MTPRGVILLRSQTTKPAEMDLGLFERCVGPGPQFKYQVPAAGFDERVTAIQGRLAKGWDMPPLIIQFAESRFHLTDGNHRHEALRRAGRTHHLAIIWTTGDEDAAELVRTGCRAAYGWRFQAGPGEPPG